MDNLDGEQPFLPPATDDTATIHIALQEVLKNALVAGGLIHGMHQACKMLDKRHAVLCVLAESFNEPVAKKLITALCKENMIPLIRVDSAKKLGEWSGLCKIDKFGKARKVAACAVVVITDFGDQTPSLDIIKGYLSKSN